jgi:hypothetical protein
VESGEHMDKGFESFWRKGTPHHGIPPYGFEECDLEKVEEMKRYTRRREASFYMSLIRCGNAHRGTSCLF